MDRPPAPPVPPPAPLLLECREEEEEGPWPLASPREAILLLALLTGRASCRPERLGAKETAAADDDSRSFDVSSSSRGRAKRRFFGNRSSFFFVPFLLPLPLGETRPLLVSSSSSSPWLPSSENQNRQE
jgi:hypothetical protein